MSEKSAKVVKRLLTYLFGLGAVLLCVSCYEYARAISDDDLKQVSSFNVLQSTLSRQQLELNSNIAAQEKILQFMVWPNERHKVQMALEYLFQQKLNASPYESTGILSLLSLQVEINRSTDEKLWTLQRGIKLNKWRKDLRPLLARHCILYRNSIQPPLVQECDSVIAQLPWQTNVDHLAKLLGVDRPTMQRALIRVRAAK